MLLGDAAFSRDPLTAGGIAHALVTAERLAAIVPYALTEGDAWLARFERERRRLLRAHGWLTRALVGLVERPVARAGDAAGDAGSPVDHATLLGVGGGIDIQPAPRRIATTIPINSATALPINSATDQKATLSQRAAVAIAAPHDTGRLPARERRQQQRRDDGGRR